MKPVVVDAAESLEALVGTSLGPTEWLEITQDRIDSFADATDDHQWIHVDAARAADGPFGRTIAHGYLTLSLGPLFFDQLLTLTGVKMGVNYGLNKVRFTNPVREGTRIRMSVDVLEVERILGGVQGRYRFVFSAENEDKPVCVAEALGRYYF